MKNPFLNFYTIFLTFIFLILEIIIVNIFNLNTVVLINTVVVAMMAGKIWELHIKCKEKDNTILIMGRKIISLYKKNKNQLNKIKNSDKS